MAGGWVTDERDKKKAIDIGVETVCSLAGTMSEQLLSGNKHGERAR